MSLSYLSVLPLSIAYQLTFLTQVYTMCIIYIYKGEPYSYIRVYYVYIYNVKLLPDTNCMRLHVHKLDALKSKICSKLLSYN